MAKNYVIIGGGTAAVNAAAAIRANDQTGLIKIYSQEKFLPYNRVNLSKELFSDLSHPKHLLKPADWYRENNVQIEIATQIKKLDPAQKQIFTAAGEAIAYDKLLLAVGAVNRTLPVPGADKEGVFNIREMADAQKCKAFVQDKNNVLVVGGGIQGLETAWAFWQAGKKVTIVEAAGRLMLRQLDEKGAKLVKEELAKAGVKVYLNTSLEEITGETKVTGAILNNGEKISCDSIFYSIGIVPNIQLAKAAGLKTNRGIVVEQTMATSAPDIYAAGDVAELDGQIEGLWSRASEQGKIAGTNMAGGESAYGKTLPVTVFRAFGLDLFSVGQLAEGEKDFVLAEGDGKTYTRVLINGNKVIGALSFQGVSKLMPYLNAIKKETPLADLDLTTASIGQLLDYLSKQPK